MSGLSPTLELLSKLRAANMRCAFRADAPADSVVIVPHEVGPLIFDLELIQSSAEQRTARIQDLEAQLVRLKEWMHVNSGEIDEDIERIAKGEPRFGQKP